MLVIGKVDVVGGETSVILKLIHPDGRVLWAARFHRPTAETFELIAEARTALVNAVQPASPETRRHATHVPNPKAYRLYVDGRYFWYNRALGPQNAPIAAKLFEDAIRLDPDYADSYAALVNAYGVTGGPLNSTLVEGERSLRSAATRALELDPTSPEALAANAMILQHVDYDWGRAESYFRQALQLQPGNASIHHRYAGLLSDMGRATEAMREFDRALDLDPLSTPTKVAKAICLFLARRYSESKALIEQLLAGTKSYRLYPYLGAILELEGAYEQASAEYQKGVEAAHEDAVSVSHWAYELAVRGRNAEARATVRKIVAESTRSSFYIALVYGRLREYDEAFRWIDQAFSEHDWNLTLLKVHPYCDSLRNDPRFREHLRQIHLN